MEKTNQGTKADTHGHKGHLSGTVGDVPPVYATVSNVHDLSVDLLPKLADYKELFCTHQDNW
ncbi:hypothetical protein [uncultured Nostoc sp.]|uniref:hypothetical protein n=1 Tax=uncultured Nostoc sp. TaxID=340711 RepID=UPI0035CBF9BD